MILFSGGFVILSEYLVDHFNWVSYNILTNNEIWKLYDVFYLFFFAGVALAQAQWDLFFFDCFLATFSAIFFPGYGFIMLRLSLSYYIVFACDRNKVTYAL